MTKKIFISYGHKDENFAQTVENKLKARGHKIWKFTKKLDHAILWNEEIVKEINQTDCVVLIWSHHAKERKTVQQEIMTARALLKPIIPIEVPYDIELAQLPPELETIQILKNPDIDELLNELVDRLNDKQLESFKYPIVSHNLHIPYHRNNHFVGRENELSKLFFDLYGPLGRKEENVPIVVRGLPGIGKTHLAIELAYRISILYPKGLYWINAHGDDLTSAFTELAYTLNLSSLEKEAKIPLAKQALIFLSNQPDILLIMDNVDSKFAYNEWVPKGAHSCAILITTRQFLFGQNQMMTLNELDDNSALNLLISHRKSLIKDKKEKEAAEKICKLVGYHPLAIENCAKELLFSTAQEYLIKMQKKSESFTEINENIVASFNISYERISHPEKDNYFYLLGHFPSDNVNYEIIKGAFKKPIIGEKVIREFYDHSLISLDIDNKLVYIHPLVKEFSLSLHDKNLKKYQSTYINALSDFLLIHSEEEHLDLILKEAYNIEHAIALAREIQDWKQYFTLIINYTKHLGYHYEISKKLHYLSELIKLVDIGIINNQNQKLIIYTEIGQTYQENAKFDDSLKYLEQAQSIFKQIKGANKADLSNILFNIGNVYYQKGDYDKAKDNYSKADKINQDCYAKNSIKLLQVRQALANIEFQKNNFQQALEYYQEILQSNGSENKVERAKTLISMSHVYRKIAYFETAKDHVNKAIDILVEVYGENHPIVADAYEVLVKVHFHQCNFENHVQILNKTLKIRTDAFGEKHPVVGNTLFDFGSYYLRRGDYKEAIDNFKKSIEISEDVFGKVHPITIERCIELASAYRQSNQYKKAFNLLEQTEKLYGHKKDSLVARLYLQFSHYYRRMSDFKKALDYINKSLVLKKDIYGTEDHPSYADSLSVLVRIYYHQYEFEKSFPVLNQILATRKKFYGADHYFVGHTLSDFSSYYLQRGQYKEAIKQLEKSIEINKKVFGENNVETIERNIELASVYRLYDEYHKALEKLVSTEQNIKILYKDDPNIYSARLNMQFSHVYRRLGEFEKSYEYINKSLEMKKTIYGTENHPSYAESLSVLVRIYYHRCEFEKSYPILEQILKIRTKTYGENHFYVGETLYDFGSYHLRKGEFTEAIEFFNKSIEISKQLFSDVHPVTIERSIELASALRQNGDYTQALELLQKIENLTQGFEVKSLIARLYLQFSHVYRRLSNFNKALDYIQKSLDLKKEIYGTGHVSYAESLSVLVRIYHHQFNFEKALPALKQILEIRKSAYGEDHFYVGHTLFDLGNYYIRKGEFAEAIEYFKQSIAISERVFGSDHPQTIERNIELASALRQNGEFNIALSQLQKIETLFIAELSDKNKELETYKKVLLARLYLQFSHVNRMLSNFKDALNYIQKSLDLKKEIYGTEDHPSYAGSLSVLIRIYYHLCEFEKALPVLKQILAIRKKHYGEKHFYFGHTLFDFGSYYLKKGEYSNSIEYLKQSIEINNSVFSENHRDTIERNIELASAYRQNGEYEQALTVLKDVQKITDTIYKDKNDILVARLYMQLSLIYRRQSKFKQALEYIEKSKTMKLAIYDKNHPSVGAALEVEAKLRIQVNQLKEANAALVQLLIIRGKRYGRNSHFFASTLHEFGCLYTIQKEFEKALKAFQKAHKKYIAIYGEAHPELGKLYMDMGIAYVGLNKLKIAQESFEKALHINSKFYHESHPYVARVNMEMGILFFAMGNDNSALRNLEESLKVFEQNFTQNYPDLARNLKFLGDVYKRSNLSDKAQNYYQQSLEIMNKIYSKDHPEVIELHHEISHN